MLTVLDTLRKTEAFLREKGVESAKLDAQLLLGQALNMDRLRLFLQYDRPMSEAELAALREPVRRRARGEPMAYILGSREFWSLPFEVGPGVLVPRPDTETLVQAALDWMPAEEELFVADVCAGSGCVGLALAKERPLIKLYATELSPEALVWLKRNVAAQQMQARVATLRGDLLDPVPAARPLDWVVSNPPYIRRGELASLEVARHEPHMALDGGEDGLDLVRRLVIQAKKRARKGILLEIGHDQGPATASILQDSGFVDVDIQKDLAGRDRVVRGRVVRDRVVSA